MSFRDLPVEEPPGIEDIYQMDTSLAIDWPTEGLSWENGGPQGCDNGESLNQPSIEQRDVFRRTVEAVKALADRVAIHVYRDGEATFST